MEVVIVAIVERTVGIVGLDVGTRSVVALSLTGLPGNLQSADKKIVVIMRK